MPKGTQKKWKVTKKAVQTADRRETVESMATAHSETTTGREGHTEKTTEEGHQTDREGHTVTVKEDLSETEKEGASALTGQEGLSGTTMREDRSETADVHLKKEILQTDRKGHTVTAKEDHSETEKEGTSALTGREGLSGTATREDLSETADDHSKKEVPLTDREDHTATEKEDRSETAEEVSDRTGETFPERTSTIARHVILRTGPQKKASTE